MAGQTALIRHLARLGGVVVRPRSTLLAIIDDGNGKMWELLPWVALCCAAAAPTQAGRALLVGRMDPLMALSHFMSMIADRASSGLIGAIVAASLLYAMKVPFDRAIDATMFMLVPFLLLMSVGVILSALGAELWFMPHRRLRGIWWVATIRGVVAYGWSVVLFVVVALAIRKRS